MLVVSTYILKQGPVLPDLSGPAGPTRGPWLVVGFWEARCIRGILPGSRPEKEDRTEIRNIFRSVKAVTGSEKLKSSGARSQELLL